MPSLPAEVAGDIWFFGDSPDLAAALAGLVRYSISGKFEKEKKS